MEKFKLSDEQYSIILEGLDLLYHESDLDGIVELKKSLLKQNEEHNYERKQMLNMINMCYDDVMGESPNDDKVQEIAVGIKKEIGDVADMFGWDDTEVGDRIWNWINDNIKEG